MGATKKVISFFAGVGGIDLGFEQAGDFEVIYANEFDKHAVTTYEENFDLEVDCRDIRDVSAEDIPVADVLLAGFPCQPFSVAGYRKGFEDERGDLFFDILRLIVQKKPQVIFLENVKNMVTHDQGNTFKVIRESLEMNGYFLKWSVLNATEYGNIPQNRERIYIVGFQSEDMFKRFQFPEQKSLTNPLDKYIDFSTPVDEKYYYSAEKNPTFYDELEKSITSQETIYQWRRRYVRENKSGVVPTLTANMGTGGHNVPLILSNQGIRKLTPRETFNIQGFPPNYILPTNTADSHLYKQAGNSVVVPVIKRIAKNIKKAMQHSTHLNVDLSSDRFSLTYTKILNNNKGQSYVIKVSNSEEELKQFALEKKVKIINTEEYFLLIKRRGSDEFFMINDANAIMAHI